MEKIAFQNTEHEIISKLLTAVRACREYFPRRKRQRLLSLFELPKQGSIIDISCGQGDMLELFYGHSPALDFYGIDMSDAVVEQASRKHPWGIFSAGLAEHLPYPDGRFAVALSCMSLHHYKKPVEVFRQAARVLSVGGIFYVADIMPKYRWQQRLYNWDRCPEPYHFEKYYTKKEVEALAAQAGLKPVGLKKMGWFSEIRILSFKK